MKKAHRLMIPLLVVISISALLGASVFAAKPAHREHPLLEGETCHCFIHDPDDPDPPGDKGCHQPFDPLCCKGCGGWCLGAHIGKAWKRPAHSWPPEEE